MAKDYYQILGVGRSASKDDIRRAYRKLAHEYHPDKGGGGDEAKFREINEAYEVLSDEAKRSQYDQFGQTFEQAKARGGFGGFSGFADFGEFMRGYGQDFSRGPFAGMEFDLGDIFSDIFGSARPRSGRRSQGIDLETTVEIAFLEAVFGVTKEITIEKQDLCPVCAGKGAEAGSKIITCPKCHGAGQIINHQRTILGDFRQVYACDKCEGVGKVPEKPCRECRGRGVKRMPKTLNIIIPPGIDDGERLKIPEEGEVGYQGSRAGDLYVVVRVKRHPEFRREGWDIHSEIKIGLAKAALGGKAEVNTVDGKVDLKIPAGTESGKILRLRHKGIPNVHGERGDYLVTVKVAIPSKLSRRARELLREFAKETGEEEDLNEGFWGRLNG